LNYYEEFTGTLIFANSGTAKVNNFNASQYTLPYYIIKIGRLVQMYWSNNVGFGLTQICYLVSTGGAIPSRFFPLGLANFLYYHPGFINTASGLAVGMVSISTINGSRRIGASATNDTTPFTLVSWPNSVGVWANGISWYSAT
jgi:hypothetical protein